MRLRTVYFCCCITALLCSQLARAADTGVTPATAPVCGVIQFSNIESGAVLQIIGSAKDPWHITELPEGILGIVNLKSSNALFVKAQNERDLDTLTVLLKLYDQPNKGVVFRMMSVEMDVQDALTLEGGWMVTGKLPTTPMKPLLPPEAAVQRMIAGGNASLLFSPKMVTGEHDSASSMTFTDNSTHVKCTFSVSNVNVNEDQTVSCRVVVDGEKSIDAIGRIHTGEAMVIGGYLKAADHDQNKSSRAVIVILKPTICADSQSIF